MLDGCGQRAETGHGNGRPDARVERAEQHGLPSAAGESGHADARAVYLRIVIEVVEATAHFEIEQAQAIDPGQIEQAEKLVLVAFGCELAKAEPFDIQRDDAAAGLIDAALLLVLYGLASGSMSIHIQNGGGFARQMSGFVQQSRGVKTGNDFETQL